MKYMLLMTATADDWGAAIGALTPAQLQAHVQFMQDIGEQLRESGELIDAQGLTPPAQARIVRASPEGKALVTDGPFPETKEFLAGYWLVQVAGPARAAAIAAEISAAPGRDGVPMNFPVEVREVGQRP